MQNKDDEKELFISVKEVTGGSNDNLGLAIAAAATIAIVGALLIRFALGITGGLITAIPVIVAFSVFKAIRKSADTTTL